MLVKSEDHSTYVAGQVWFFASYADEPMALVSIWSLLRRQPDLHACEWQERDNPELVPLDHTLAAVTFTRSRDGVVRTLIPPQLHSV